MASPSYTTSSNIPIPTYRSIGNKVIVPVGKPADHCLLVPVTSVVTPGIYNSSGINDNNNGGGGGDSPWSGAFTKTFMRGGSLSSASGMENSSGENNNRGGNVGYLLRDRPFTMISKLSAEFIGTLLLTFIGSLSGLNIISNSNAVLHAAFAHGLTVFALVSSFGHISGAHFNPAISLAVVLVGKMKILNAIFYWISQLAGGFCGALIVRFVTDQKQYDSIAGGATIVPPNQLWYQAAMVELILTAILAQTILTCAVDTSTVSIAPLAIGMTVALDIFAGATLSGASMNPARSFGPCLVASYFLQNGPGTKLTDPIWTSHFVFWLGPLLGGVLAAFIFKTLLTRGNNRICP
ncbi:unnamed protein product [Meloidogyne enterolobii]|uniref:Uncharacterized protein n=1 Tax=Meloidogyne enterolobii TaxID=390850 RepID=A0ACB0Y0D9_MELEN